MLLAASAQAGILEPIAATGWNQDVVIGVGEAYSSGSTAQMDEPGAQGGGATVWYGVGYNGSYPATGLPTGLTQSQTSSDLYFQLQSFGSAGGTNNNAVYGGGALTLTAAGRYDRIALLGATGQGTANLTITLNYTTGSPDVYSNLGSGSINQDWFNGGSIAYIANGRISTVDGGFEYVNSTNPRLYEHFFDADETRYLQSVTIIDAGEGDPPQHNVIMAISGEQVPEPTTMMILAAGLPLLLKHRRKRD